MSMNVAQKLISKHLIEGSLQVGTDIALKIDQTLTQDATGTMAYLQFEAMGIPQVKTKLSVSYIDHNTLQSGFENADDHRFLQTFAAKYGIYFSRPGNGICHQVHLERFGVPGQTLLGSDSHTPTGGGLGMLAIGAGGLDVAVAMAGGPFYLKMPQIVEVELKGALQSLVSAKDIILEVLRRLTCKGGVGKIMEYTGPGVKTLSVPERATITNMGAELGATTSVFPSDTVTKTFLTAQGRAKSWKEIIADKNAKYDEKIIIDLSKLEPLVAKPHLPDNVCKVKELKAIEVDQVLIGSCTNSSYRDLISVAKILKGKKVHPNVSLGIAPGSKQVLEMITANGALADILSSGARLLESTCGFCIGMGLSPRTNGISVRTNNRNFKGRSGTPSGEIYLVSPETAAATALKGKITDPRTLLKKAIKLSMPQKFLIDDSMIIKPRKDGSKLEVYRGPNIASLPIKDILPNNLLGPCLLKVEDNITTDHIMPAGSKILPLRSNIPKIAEHVFSVIDPTFAERAKKAGGGFIVGGENYGQGSSREHAALAPMYLCIKAVIAKSFARIHKANLINFGLIPLVFKNTADYQNIDQEDILELPKVKEELKSGNTITILNKTKAKEILTKIELSAREKNIILAGGLLNYTKNKA
ncbi:MAG: aconitate hydratase [Candidatus Margulisbacteria bacterium]|nr:aconitate hydratase [Candidatus Margulisiibacteriota bacterium]